MKKLLIGVLLAFTITILTACAAALLGGPGNGSYESSGEGRGGAQSAVDQKISATLQEKLSSDPLTTGSEIQVETTNAVVVLKGDVTSVRISRRAAELAGQVDMVRAVRNHLWVGSSD
ncbi:hypothetical protein MnTg04_01362 [bacterium MnTg04]|nr:hypothetical protein MnTg04_01362 [bacterium MnTg04]